MDHEDIIFNILLQADIHDIKNLSLVNKKNYSVSNNIHFWHTKFKQDQLTLPIFNTIISDWIQIYQFACRLMDYDQYMGKQYVWYRKKK
jgi:hypothetical protein